MRIKTFGAIYIGTYEVSIKIFELPVGKKIRVIDLARKRIELGHELYTKGDVDYKLVEELCQVLNEFHNTMASYGVEQYLAYAGSGLREAKNALFILDQIKIRTGIQVQVLSNSEHRFITYKSLALEDLFQQMIQESAALIDVGGGSMQATLYFNGKVVTTQHIDLGIMRIRGRLSGIESMVLDYENRIQEMVDRELSSFKSLFLPAEKVKYVILIGDYMGEITKNVKRRMEDDCIEAERFLKLLNKFESKNTQVMAEELSLASDPLMAPSVVLYKRLVEQLGAEYVWYPGVNIADGIACEFALQNKIIKTAHNFDEDVLSAARSLAERYLSYNEHAEYIAEVSKTIFNAMKKAHGMGKRQGLLLRVTAILHDCGRYVSMIKHAEIGYEIIMASEIIGLTHLEREIVASAIKYNVTEDIAPYEEMMDKMDRESYMAMIKLSAILRLANAMDRSHKQKLKNIKAALKEKQLIVTVEARGNIMLEKELFSEFAKPFEKIFSVKPVLREKRISLV